MTLEEFRETAQHLRRPSSYGIFDGVVYDVDGTFWDDREADPESFLHINLKDKQWRLVIGCDEFVAPDGNCTTTCELPKLEERLYEFAKAEGLV